MRNSFKALLVGASILTPLGAIAAEIDSAPVNLMGTELLQLAQANGSSGTGSAGSGSVGSSSAGKSSNGLNPRVGPGSSLSPSSGVADDMSKQRDEDKRLREKQKSKGMTP